MSKQISLTQGQHAVVDDADFEWLSQWKWFAQRNQCGGFYAARRDEAGSVRFMHREINATPPGLVTDHRDGDGLNNRRRNLRSATQLQNMMNRRGKRGGSSARKGVWFDKGQAGTKRWRSAIRIGGKLKYLGRFASEDEAGDAYAAAARSHFGEFANATPGETA